MKHLLPILGLCALFFSCNEQTVRKQGFDIHGIDVSHHQQKIDWDLIASQNVRFAFVKATEGENHKDTLYCQNWDAIKAAGIKRGAYHFFRPNADPILQAQNFIDLAELGHGDLPPVLDVEVLDGVDSETLQLGVSTWLSTIENHFKIKPIIYTNQKFFNKHLVAHFTGYPIWIARYSSWRKPRLEKNHEWSFWQYGNRGRLAGIDGNVDFNVFKGSESELEALCLVRPRPLLHTPPPPPPSDDAVAVTP